MGKLKIGWKEYNVSVKDELRDSEDRRCHGIISYLQEVILLAGDNTPKQGIVSLIHEVIHGSDDMFAIGLTEEQVVKLANALGSVVIDNPHIFNVDIEEAIKDEQDTVKKGTSSKGTKA